MQNTLSTSLPSPSRWGIDATIAGRPIIRGILNVTSISGNQILGTANFRGVDIPITGVWEESSKQIRFDTPYASFAGQLTIFDDPAIKIRHLILRGRFIMKPPSLQAGEYGDWIAATDTQLTGPPIYTGALPPSGAYLLSDLLYRGRMFR